MLIGSNDRIIENENCIINDQVNGSYDDVLIERVFSVALVLWRVGPILRNGYGNQGQKMCYIAPGN